MYAAILIVLLILGILLIARGVRRRSVTAASGGVLVLLATLIFFSTLDQWGEWLWFESAGYGHRYWTVIIATIVCAAVFGVLGWLAVFLLTLRVRRSLSARYWPELVGAVIGMAWGGASWETILFFVNGVPAGIADPIFGRDAGYYLFRLPFYNDLFGLLLLFIIVALVACGIALATETSVAHVRHWVNQRFGRTGLYDVLAAPGVPVEYLFVPVGALFVLIAWWHYLGVFNLMYSPMGVVYGPGWADVHVRLPGHAITGAVALLLAVGLLLPPLHAVYRRIFRWASPAMGAIFGPAIIVAGVWILALFVAPGIVQWLVVTPNEITLERPYIANNIRFTRAAFGLDRVEARQFPMTGTLNQAVVNANKDILDNVRIWDWRALDAVYRQFQAIRLYYDFHDVDIDRYNYGGQYRQVMLSARELNQSNLPQQSQTFVNLIFKFTHGYGLVMSDVSKFTPEDLPVFLIKDIPPATSDPSLKVDQPAIYFGEETNSYVVVNSATPEFDYPTGADNAYVNYAGNGGVELSSLWRKFLFGWKFDGTQFFFSSYPRANSRIMFHRNITDRVRTLAPFLQFDEDPYIVLVNGKLYWILDAYTTSSNFPYSTPFYAGENPSYQGGAPAQQQGFQQPPASAFEGDNYARNAVKAVVDAYDGSVSFYVFTPDDPLIRTWQRIFPGMFKPESAMPADLRAHVRYPHKFLLLQGSVYAKYHMEDPVVFYNQEDLWVRATETYAGRMQPIEPYYIMWAVPGTETREFSVILPFTPKNRQVLVGWIAGLCDGENYGRMVSYRFPKEKTVIGTQQVETKIDQDAYLSGQLSLWDQHGSHVMRGDVLAIPIDDTLLYVEPIYLKAETAAYPELRLVVVMQGETMAYAETFDAALQRLLSGLGGQPAAPAPAAALQAPQAQAAPRVPQAAPQVNPQLAREARDAFESYLRLQGQGRFAEAAQQLERLRNILQQMAGEKK